MGKCTSKITRKNESMANLTGNTEQELSFQEIESAVSIAKSVNKLEKAFISDALKNHYLFCGLTKKDLKSLFLRMKYYKVPANEVVFMQGSVGKKFYILESGQIEVVKNDVKIAILQPGKTFGEMALLTSSTRRATLRTTEVSTLWAIGRSHFLETIKLVYKKNYEINKDFISNLSIFSGLSEKEKGLITEICVQHEYPDGQRIVCEGDQDPLIYVLKQGSASAKVKGNEKYRIHAGDIFGAEVILGPKQTHSVTIYPIGRVQCLSIDKGNLVSIIGDNFKEIFYKAQARNSLNADELTGMLTKELNSTLVDEMVWYSYIAGTSLDRVLSNPSKIAVLCLGTIRSEQSVFVQNSVLGIGNHNQKSNKNFVAETDVVLGIAKKKVIERCTRTKVETLANQLRISRFLSKSDIASGIELNKLRYLASKSTFKEFDAKDIVFKINQEAKEFYIIKRGHVKIYSERKFLRSLGRYDSFGMQSARNGKRTNNAKADTSTLCLVVPIDAFMSVASDRDEKLRLRKSTLSVFKFKDLNLIGISSHIGISSQIGISGQKDYKSTYIAGISEDSPQFEVTIIKKNQVPNIDICYELVRMVDISMSIEHNGLPKILNTFNDQIFVYIIYAHIPNVKLRTKIKDCINEDSARFLTACLLAILKKFKHANIIYRDLCTDNICLKKNGYPYLPDLTCAKKVRGKTSTVIGNPFYNAPEMINGKQYSDSVDYWSLGIVIYELLYGYLPFEIKSSDSLIDVSEKILNSELKFPSNSVYMKANLLIQGLLMKKVSERYSAKDIKYSKWMHSVDWSRINSEEVISPYNQISMPNFYKKLSKVTDNVLLQRYINVRFIQENDIESNSKRSVRFNWDKYF